MIRGSNVVPLVEEVVNMVVLSLSEPVTICKVFCSICNSTWHFFDSLGKLGSSTFHIKSGQFSSCRLEIVFSDKSYQWLIIERVLVAFRENLDNFVACFKLKLISHTFMEPIKSWISTYFFVIICRHYLLVIISSDVVANYFLDILKCWRKA